METTPTFVMPPVSTAEDTGNEVHDVSRLTSGVTDLLGPVVVSGRYSADCFKYPERQLQAGAPEKEPDWSTYDSKAPGKIDW